MEMQVGRDVEIWVLSHVLLEKAKMNEFFDGAGASQTLPLIIILGLTVTYISASSWMRKGKSIKFTLALINKIHSCLALPFSLTI